jgi:hypothetical protein
MALQYNNPDSAILIAKSITCGVPQRGGFQQNTALRSVGFFIPPNPSRKLGVWGNKKTPMFHIGVLLSERRDSNPRPRPWQGRALPTELLSLVWVCKSKEISKMSKQIMKLI